MRRRHWLAAVALMAAGCSSSTRTTKKKSGKISGRQRMNRGPQGFGDVLVTAYIDDEVAYEVTRTMTRWDFWRVASYDASTRTFTEINALQAGTSNRLEPPVPCP